MEKNNLVPHQHIGDGLYMKDNGFQIEISVNHHDNVVAYLDMSDFDAAIDYINSVRKRLKHQ